MQARRFRGWLAIAMLAGLGVTATQCSFEQGEDASPIGASLGAGSGSGSGSPEVCTAAPDFRCAADGLFGYGTNNCHHHVNCFAD